MTISNFESPSNSRIIRWRHAGNDIEKNYQGVAHGTAFADGSGVVVVEPYSGHPHNAVIFNSDGTQRVRLTNPLTAIGAICFVYPHYVRTELTLVVALRDLEYGCVFDMDGRCLRTYETR